MGSECDERQDGIIELLSSIKQRTEPRVGYIQFGDFTDSIIKLDDAYFNDFDSDNLVIRDYANVIRELECEGIAEKQSSDLENTVRKALEEFDSVSNSRGRHKKIVLFNECNFEEYRFVQEACNISRIAHNESVEVTVVNVGVLNGNINLQNHSACIVGDSPDRVISIENLQPESFEAVIDEFVDAVCTMNGQTNEPTVDPTEIPTSDPTKEPTEAPTFTPTIDPTIDPSADPSVVPTLGPTEAPSSSPTIAPTSEPTVAPTFDPTADPTKYPSIAPTADPTIGPSIDPIIDPTNDPTADPTSLPTNFPTFDPTEESTTQRPTRQPVPTMHPTLSPVPSSEPTYTPTASPFANTVCSKEKLDIIFLIDNTCTLSDDECYSRQDGVSELLASLKQSTEPRIAYFSFLNAVDEIVSLNDLYFNDIDEDQVVIQDYVRLIKSRSCSSNNVQGSVHLYDAINSALTHFEDNFGEDRHQKIVLFNACETDNGSDESACGIQLTVNGNFVEVTVVNVGTENGNLPSNYMQCLVYDNDERFFTLNDTEANSFEAIMEGFVSAVCNENVPPTQSPTTFPTSEPTESPLESPSNQPTRSPTIEPSTTPSKSPTLKPSRQPTPEPTPRPTYALLCDSV